MELVAIGCRFALGTVFLLAGLAKVPRRREFVRVVAAYQILPTRWVSPIARAIPPLELGIGVLLLVGLGTQWVAIVVAAVLALFSVGVTVNLARGRDLDCGCFAVGVAQRITWSLVARNAVFVAMSVIVFSATPRALSLDELLLGGASTHVTSGDATALLFTAAALVLVSAVVVELAQLRGHGAALSRTAAGEAR